MDKYYATYLGHFFNIEKKCQHITVVLQVNCPSYERSVIW